VAEDGHDESDTDDTRIVQRPPVDDATRVVRRAQPVDEPTDDPTDEATRLVRRSPPVDDATRVVQRAVPAVEAPDSEAPDDATRVVVRPVDKNDDRTVVRPRSAPAAVPAPHQPLARGGRRAFVPGVEPGEPTDVYGVRAVPESPARSIRSFASAAPERSLPIESADGAARDRTRNASRGIRVLAIVITVAVVAAVGLAVLVLKLFAAS
jgi:hypothetical protein